MGCKRTMWTGTCKRELLCNEYEVCSGFVWPITIGAMMRTSTVVVVGIAVAACLGAGAAGATTAGSAGATFAVAEPTANAGEWAAPARDYSNSRYSPLSQITTANAKNRRVAWTFSTGVLRGHEGQPLVVDKTMYLITPYPNVAYALDLTQPGFPLKWKYRPENDQRAIGAACCDVVNRGASLGDGKLVYNLLDGHTVAGDVSNGMQDWRTKIADLDRA